MRERFDEEFQALLDSNNPDARSIWTYIARLVQQFGLYRHGITIDEILSETYSRGIQQLVERKKPIENPLGWVRLTALNVVREMSRNQRRSVPFETLGVEPEIFSTEISESLIAGEDIEDNIRILYAALQRLTPREQQILYLRNVCGLSWCEIGERLNRCGEKTLNKTALRQQGCRALARLRKLFHALKSQDPDDRAA